MLAKSDPPNQAAPRMVKLVAMCIVFAVVLAYANTISAPFIFDDHRGIIVNPTIRQLWPLQEVLMPPAKATGAGGRPVVNLSLALNYAIGGLDVRGYHLFNIAIHACVALLLFGLVRRTLLLPGVRERFGPAALPLSASVTLLWALHPLQTESVTCVIQRTELLGSLFYLLTLYTFVRSLTADRPGRWLALSIAASFIGMAAKEIMATVPVIVLLYDRAFVAGSVREAWARRKRYYLGLAATWLLLFTLVLLNDSRGGVVGFGLGMSAWDYALTQCGAIIMYLKLSLWPHPLVLDYGAEVVSGIGEVWWQGVLLLGLVGLTLWAVVRRPKAGFVAFTAFAVLAPSSSFVPLTTQTMAEHRMYLPLAGVLLLVILWCWQKWRRWTVPVATGVALLAGFATIMRNQDYQSEISIWTDTVTKRPENARARVGLGSALASADRVDEAITHYQEALRLKPHYPDAEFNLGNAYFKKGDFPAATRHYMRTVELKPDYPDAHYGLGYCLFRLGRLDEAISHYRRAEELRPDDPVVLRSFASALMIARQFDEAKARFERLLALTPNDAGARGEYGAMLAQAGLIDEATQQLEIVLRIEPDNRVARYPLALLYVRANDDKAAERHLTILLKQDPQLAEAHNTLGELLLRQERWAEAVAQLQEAVRLKPDFAVARRNLDRAELLRDLRAR
jgi:protein O-mannosyl-transferase